MLGVILENIITKENEYLYFKNDNNNLIYYGFCVQNSNIAPIDKNIINKIYNILKINENCTYVEDFLDYKVYLDKKNNIKHYLKNGIEDFEMLFNSNGEDLTLYNTNDNEISNTGSKKFQLWPYIIKFSLAAIAGLSIGFMLNSITAAQIQGGNIIDNMQYDFSKTLYSISEYMNLDLKCIDCNQAIDLIHSSKLPDGAKVILANKSLLQDVFPYYQNTSMEYIIKYKLEDLKLRIYEPTDKFITDPNKSAGFYTEIVPNVLHLKKDSDYTEYIKHEFVHLLQSPNCQYYFLKEAIAEIASIEYLGKSVVNYKYCVDNVSLLMDTIGPKIIWEAVFSGDDTNLQNVLRDNLSENDYNELISYLLATPEETEESYNKINGLIANLYRNINGREIQDDINIYTYEFKYDYFENHIRRIYFNEENMKNNNPYFNLKDYDYEFYPINEIFPDQTIKSYNNKIK